MLCNVIHVFHMSFCLMHLLFLFFLAASCTSHPVALVRKRGFSVAGSCRETLYFLNLLKEVKHTAGQFNCVLFTSLPTLR